MNSEHQFPAEPGKGFQDTANALPPFVGERAVVVEPVGEFFVFGADAPLFGLRQYVSYATDTRCRESVLA